MAGTGVVIEPLGLALPEVLERASLAEGLGAEALWTAQMPNQRDAATIAAALAVTTTRTGIGAGILPVYGRPPVAMAQFALTLDELSGGRFSLGVGLGARRVGAWSVGGRDLPAEPSMRDYLNVVTALVRDGEVAHEGRWYGGHAAYPAPRRADRPVLVGAFGPRLVRLAGELADGLVVWMAGPDYVRDHIVPNVLAGRARRGLGLDGFQIVQFVPALVSDDPAECREAGRRHVLPYLRVPTYQRMFEQAGFGAGEAVELAGQIGAYGRPAEVKERIARFYEAGVTQVVVAPALPAHRDRDRFLETVAASVK